LRAYKRKVDNPYRVVHRWLKHYASRVEEWAYEMQWITPIELAHNESSVKVCEVHHCKVLQTAATDRVCKVDCWNAGTALARQVYYLEELTRQVDHGCMIKVTPLVE
jgi:hypothetical protein